MTAQSTSIAVHAEIMDERTLSLVELVACTRIESAGIVAMVDAGVLDPVVRSSSAQGDIDAWQFHARDARRLRTAQRLVDDLGVNLAGVAVILDLLDERTALLTRLAALEKL